MTEYPSLKSTRVKALHFGSFWMNVPTSEFRIWINLSPQPCLLYSFGRFIRTSNPEGDGPTSRLDDAERPITRTGALWPSTLVPAASYSPEMTGDPLFFSAQELPKAFCWSRFGLEWSCCSWNRKATPASNNARWSFCPEAPCTSLTPLHQKGGESKLEHDGNIIFGYLSCIVGVYY